MDYDKKEIGKRIQNIRKNMGLTLEQFGKKTGRTLKSNVSKWENGLTIPNKKRLEIIAELGEVSVDYLLTGNPKKNKEYVQYFFEEVCLKTGELHTQYKDYKLDDDRKGLFDLYQEVVEKFKFNSNSAYTTTNINLLINRTYKKVLKFDKGEERYIAFSLYEALMDMLYSREMNPKRLIWDINHELEHAILNMKSIVARAEELSVREDTINSIKESQKYLEELDEFRIKKNSQLELNIENFEEIDLYDYERPKLL